MTKKTTERTEAMKAIQEQYLDMMIRLSFDLEDDEAVQQILSDSSPELPPQAQALAAQAWRKAQRKMKAHEKAVRHKQHTETLKWMFPRTLQAVACLLLILFIATPVALASSSDLRARVMQLLIGIDQNQGVTNFHFVEKQDESLIIPDEWTGEYFPSIIPDGMTLSRCSELIHLIEYRDEAGRLVGFSEYDEFTSLSAGIENATIYDADVHGSLAHVIEGDSVDGCSHHVTVVWANDSKWFSVGTIGFDAEETLEIARSVKKIFW